MKNIALLRLFTIMALSVAASATAADSAQAWDYEGDFRVRYEGNEALNDGPERHRGVLRFRLGGSFRVNDFLTVGARVVTGDPENPRTADVTIGDFLDDFELSLDRAYVETRHRSFFATAGKFRNPFTTTELVWDGDVNPTGAAADAGIGNFSETVSARLAGIFMLVDERSIADDSTMWGTQLVLANRDSGSFSFRVAAAYWDYSISGLEHADSPGDVRGNYLTPDGSAYLSDFNLADLNVTLSLPGFGPDYPVRMVVDMVENLGAAVDEDRGFWLDLFVGSAWAKGKFELRYGFAQCETDAVLGAFSNDNIPLATNYRNHTFRVSYGLLKDTNLSLTWYYFSRLTEDSRYLEEIPGDYSSRIRLDLMLRF